MYFDLLTFSIKKNVSKCPLNRKISFPLKDKLSILVYQSILVWEKVGKSEKLT